MLPRFRSASAAVVGLALLLAGAPTASAATTGTATATGTATGVTDPRVVAHFDFDAGQTPEDSAIEPDGSVDLSMATANSVVHRAPDGTSTVLAQFPTTGKCSILKGASTLGLVRTLDGTLYVIECSGDADQGVWRVAPGRAPVQIAQLPPAGFANGLAVDDATGTLYATDSVLGEVWRIPTDGTAASVWASGPAFEKKQLVGAIGIAVHHGSVWVGNSEAGTIVQVPIRPDGSAGPILTAVSGLTSSTGKFTVVGPLDTIIVPMVVAGQVVLVRPGGTPQVALTSADGLSTPTSVTYSDGQIYVTSAAYLTGTDPNLLVADYDPCAIAAVRAG
ncbi:MAG: hypothetical protein ACJ786_27665 [Catenulispora sp.]